MRFRIEVRTVSVLAMGFILLALSGEAALAQTGGSGRGRPIPPRAQQRIERAVLHELRMLPYYSVFDNIDFKVVGYRVELYGQVVRPTLKSDAAGVVKRIEGVEEVVNRIEVLPVSPFDDRLRRAVYRALYSHPVLQKYAIQPVPPIHIIVKNGNVTLVGVVLNEMDKNVANIQANSVGGVFSVTNKLQTEKGRRPS